MNPGAPAAGGSKKGLDDDGPAPPIPDRCRALRSTHGRHGAHRLRGWLVLPGRDVVGFGRELELGGAGIAIKAGEFPWSAAKLTNVILTEVAAQHPELGVSQIDVTTLGPAPAWAGGQRGDLDLFSEVALPNQQELADKAKDKVALVHQTYGDAQQGWFVPPMRPSPGSPWPG